MFSYGQLLTQKSLILIEYKFQAWKPRGCTLEQDLNSYDDKVGWIFYQFVLVNQNWHFLNTQKRDFSSVIEALPIKAFNKSMFAPSGGIPSFKI